MEGKMRAIIKRPDEQYGHVTNISTSLQNLQNIVSGHIEVVPLPFLGEGVVLICNEEGKLLDLTPSQYIAELHDVVCGEFLVIGSKGEELDDLQLDFGAWKAAVDAWDAEFYLWGNLEDLIREEGG